MRIDAATLSWFACPACHGELRQQDARLVCAGCGLAYPVLDGIPVLIADRAEAPSQDPDDAGGSTLHR